MKRFKKYGYFPAALIAVLSALGYLIYSIVELIFNY